MSAVARRRGWLLSGIGVGVAGLHLLALLALGPGWIDPDAPGPGPHAQRFELRDVVAPIPAAVPPAHETPAVPAAPREGQRAAAIDRPRVQRNTAPMASADLPNAQPLAVGIPAEPESVIDAAARAASVAAAATEVPVYVTRLPPAGHWRYRLQRGLMVGEADLQWAPREGAHYEMLLTGRVAGVTMLEWASQGQLDAAGVAPERLAIRRRGRDRQAVNFQRETGKITFSGPTHELPLLPGVQDRLSWMVQLSAIVAAAPERHGPGANVVLFVAGARGDADLWTFVVQGIEPLDARPTLKLVREPRRRYDTRAEVWLDPADHFMPLRLVQTPSGGGAALELHREREAR